MSYSKDFKDKVIEIMTREQFTVRTAAQHFNLSTQTIQRWKKTTEAKSYPGRPPKISTEEILAGIKEYPDDYQYERAKRFRCQYSCCF